MASNKRINKAYVRYDGSGRVIPGALLLNRFKPTGGGKWHEIPAYECCNPSPVALPLRMLFSSILEVGAIVGDVTDVANWNTYFDLPTYGAPFTSVSVTGDEVKLYGGSSIIIKQELFDQSDELGTYLLEVDDTAGCIIEVEYDGFGYDQNSGCTNLVSVNFPEVITIASYAFGRCEALVTVNLPKVTSLSPLGNVSGGAFANVESMTSLSLPSLTYAGVDSFAGMTSLTSINLPQVTTIEDSCIRLCYSLTTINIPNCNTLGSTVGYNDVFQSISGNNITLTVPSALMTCNSGNPDGDIQYLQANNTVTVVTV